MEIIIWSGLISVIISTISAVVVGLVLKRYDFKSEYYKLIIRKRLKAYSYIEKHLTILKSTFIDEDDKQYHSIFYYGHENYNLKLQAFEQSMVENIWFTPETIECLLELNELYFSIARQVAKVKDKSNRSLIEIGKEHFQKINELGGKLQDSVKEDLLNLHNIKSFNKKKWKINLSNILNRWNLHL
ncbi:MAG: hypothetical protein M9949_14490 [Candidatus Kapabacteria bacterium]|nr:hypothetical protein [Candidatus Kapabacteria bacterium]